MCRPDTLVVQPSQAEPDILQTQKQQQQQAQQQSASRYEENGDEYQKSWLKNASKYLSTEPPSVKMPGNMVTRPSSVRSETPGPNDLPGDDAIVIEAESGELEQPLVTVPPTPAVVSTEPEPKPGLEEDTESNAIVVPRSLGWFCNADAECQAADENSRCLDGVCECRNTQSKWDNGTLCSAQKTGCIGGTFQCRSTGACISWFFVCDGRADCDDGSDEECEGAKCPVQAFKCAKSGKCVSRAALCDGTKDCPNGEDETGCQDRRRKY